MAHHDRCIRERVGALTRKGWLSDSTAGELYGFPMSTAKESLRKYRRDQQVGMRKATGFRFAITAGRRRIPWLATASA